VKNIKHKINDRANFVLIMLICATGLLSARQINLYKSERIVAGNAKESGEKNYLEYHVLKDDQKIYVVGIELDYDIPFPVLKVFDNGASVLISAFEASLTFYNSSGKIILKSNILKDFNVEYERSLYSAISGDYLAISLCPNKADYTIVQIYNNLGQIIDDWQFQEKFMDGLSFSSTANLLAISVHNWQQNNLSKSTIFFDSNGAQISKIPFSFTKGQFVESENIFVGYSNDNCYVYNFELKKINFESRSIEDEMILMAEYIHDKIFIVIAEKPYLEKGDWYYINPTFRVVDIMGDLRMQTNIKSKPFSKYELLKNDASIKFKTENELIQIN
jgi:hypothetical protein